MAKIKWRGGAMMAPLPPTLVTCADGGKENVLTVAWTGIVNTIPPKTYISVRPSRYSYGLIKNSGEFVIHLTTENLLRACDWCGVHTGAKEDKFEKMNLEREPANEVSAPLLKDSPVALECRVTGVIPLGSHDMFLADIVCVDVDESLLDKAGKLHLEKAGLVAYAHGDYFALGRHLGAFGFSVRKKSGKKK